MTWTAVLLVALGSAIGGVARYGVGEWMAFHCGTDFPWGTLAVNIAGSFLIGLAYGLSEEAWVRNLIGVGILGGFTTFSSFSWQTLCLMQEGRAAYALTNVAGSFAGCLVAVWLGWWLAQALRPAFGITSA